jgi:hypothetical protein
MCSPARVELLSIFARSRFNRPVVGSPRRLYLSSGFLDVKELVASAILIPPELLWTAGFDGLGYQMEAE